MYSTARGGLTPSPATPLHLHTYHERDSNSRQKAVSYVLPFQLMWYAAFEVHTLACSVLAAPHLVTKEVIRRNWNLASAHAQLGRLRDASWDFRFSWRTLTTSFFWVMTSFSHVGSCWVSGVPARFSETLIILNTRCQPSWPYHSCVPYSVGVLQMRRNRARKQQTIVPNYCI
jgi:hypothetical protein